MGRPTKHIWNQEKAKRIEKLAIIGCNDNHIAAIEDIPETSLKRHYAKELSDGRAKGVGAIAGTLYQMALSGKNPAATFFYLKCRARWQEVQHIKVEADIETKETLVLTTSWREVPKNESKP